MTELLPVASQKEKDQNRHSGMHSLSLVILSPAEPLESASLKKASPLEFLSLAPAVMSQNKPLFFMKLPSLRYFAVVMQIRLIQQVSS